MTKQDFVNIFVRQRKIKKTIIVELSIFLFSIFIYLLSVKFMNIELKPIEFSIGWFLAEIMSIVFWLVFSFKSEKEKFNNELVKDIIE